MSNFKKPLGFFWVFIKVAISLIISVAALTGMISMFHFMDPDFSVGMFDMLVQGSPMAWLLLGLAATIVYAVLSRFAVWRNLGGRQSEPCRPDTQQSD